MKKLVLLALLLTTPAYAGDLSVMSQGVYGRTNNNSMDDNVQYVGRGEYNVYREFGLVGEFNYQYRADYGVGSLFGYGLMGGVTFRPDTPFAGKVNPYLLGEVGGFRWGFNEHQAFQDQGITVELKDSIACKLGGGLDIAIAPKWDLNIEVTWFKSDIDQSQSDGGHALGGPTIGNEQVDVAVGLRYTF